MKLFDYNHLITVIDNIEIREEKERNDEIISLEKQVRVKENEIIQSGILDDWNNLKLLCKKAKIRLFPYGSNIMNEYAKFEDNGKFLKYVHNAGGCGSDYYGFKYLPGNGIIWEVYHLTSCHFWEGFSGTTLPCGEKSKNEMKLKILNCFLNTYEIYRCFQMKMIEDKFKDRIKMEDLM